MKKVLFSLVALLAVMTVQAQSLCGSWRIMQPIVETEEEGTVLLQNIMYTFNEDGTYTCADEFTVSTEPAPTMALEVATNIEIKGTYTLEGNKLTMTPDINTYKAELLSISMNGQVTDNPMVRSNIMSMLTDNDFKAQFCEVENYTVNVGESLLEMNDGETATNYARISTMKK